MVTMESLGMSHVRNNHLSLIASTEMWQTCWADQIADSVKLQSYRIITGEVISHKKLTRVSEFCPSLRINWLKFDSNELYC